MDILLVIAAIIAFIVRIAKVSENKQKNQEESRQRPAEIFEKLPDDLFEHYKKVRTMMADFKEWDRDYEGVNHPDGEGYGQEKIEKNDYVGCPQYTKGFKETEGTESSEGMCIEPNANHCAVEHFEDTVYASEIGNTENEFTHKDFVKGIIMAEILSKPKSLQ